MAKINCAFSPSYVRILHIEFLCIVVSTTANTNVFSSIPYVTTKSTRQIYTFI